MILLNAENLVMKTIVVIGGGFAGMNFIRHIDLKQYRVKLIDRNNFHSFPPLFYQIASSGLEPSNIAFPFRREFKRLKGVSYHMGHVKNVDIAAKTVTTSYETLSYDYLVIAAGSTNNFFGMPDMQKNVYCIKTPAEAAHTRNEILDRLERGVLEKDPEKRRRLLSFLVVGGGPSGVEIAGALGEMKRYVVPREYPEINPDDISITLVEGADRLLGAMSTKSSANALKYLKELMVEVRLNVRLTSYSDKIVTFASGETLYSETLIWTAGVKGEPIPGLPEEYLGRGGRIKVDACGRIAGRDDVMAIGDISICESDEYPAGLPQMAQPAIQQGRHLAKCLNTGDFSSPLVYKDKGSMATIGRNRAVADLNHARLAGYPAWLAWMFIHLISLLGMRNKIVVLFNWIWNYITYSTSLRILLRPTRFPERRHWGD